MKDRDCKNKKEQHIIKSDIDNEKYYTEQELNQALEMQAQKLHSNYEEVYERKLAQCEQKYKEMIRKYNVALFVMIVIMVTLAYIYIISLE